MNDRIDIYNHDASDEKLDNILAKLEIIMNALTDMTTKFTTDLDLLIPGGARAMIAGLRADLAAALADKQASQDSLLASQAENAEAMAAVAAARQRVRDLGPEFGVTFPSE